MAVRLLEALVKDFGTHTKFVTVLFVFITLLGCGALQAGTLTSRPSGFSRPTRMPRPTRISLPTGGFLTASSVVDFGTVAVGDTAYEPIPSRTMAVLRL